MDFTKHKESNVGSKSEGRQWVEHCINLYVDLCKENRLESRSGLCTELLAVVEIPGAPGRSQGAQRGSFLGSGSGRFSGRGGGWGAWLGGGGGVGVDCRGMGR